MAAGGCASSAALGRGACKFVAIRHPMDNTLEIFIYSDSLGLPRSRDGILCSQIYSELFRSWIEMNRKDSKVYLFNRSQGGIKLRQLWGLFQMDSAYFGSSGEKIMVLHCGIVDCAPRPIPDWLRYIISRFPGKMQRPVVHFLHNNRPRILKSGLMWRATRPERFSFLYKQIVTKATAQFSRVYIINIFPTTDNIETHSPGLSRSIEWYNDIIRQVINETKADNLIFIDVHKFIRESHCELQSIINKTDGHHLTVQGHRLLFDLLIEKEKAFLEQKS